MSKKCECNDYEILEVSNVIQIENGWALRLCICKCKKCGRTQHKWLDESPSKAQEELNKGVSVLLTWNNYNKYKHEIKEGWICPRCNKVNAPSVKQCDCNNTTECNHDWILEKQTKYYKCKNCGEIKIWTQ